VALLLELGLDSPTKGAIGTGALLAGFPGLNAPAKTRAAWQAATAPGIGLAAAIGVLSGSNAIAAVAAMALFGVAAGYCFSVSLRFAITGLSIALSLLITQDLPLDTADTLPALVFATAGGLLQAAFSLCVWAAGDRAPEKEGERWNAGAAHNALRGNLTLRSTSFRHALRFGTALAVGVATYWLVGMHEHGFWIPLTILFVLRPGRNETFKRLAWRAFGTIVGLILATALAEWLRGDEIAIAMALTVATGFAYGLLTVQYALFTAAITTYAVLLADSIGEPALRAAGQRGLATAIGIAIAATAFLLWPKSRARPGLRELGDRQRLSGVDSSGFDRERAVPFDRHAEGFQRRFPALQFQSLAAIRPGGFRCEDAAPFDRGAQRCQFAAGCFEASRAECKGVSGTVEEPAGGSSDGRHDFRERAQSAFEDESDFDPFDDDVAFGAHRCAAHGPGQAFRSDRFDGAVFARRGAVDDRKFVERAFRRPGVVEDRHRVGEVACNHEAEHDEIAFDGAADDRFVSFQRFAFELPGGTGDRARGEDRTRGQCRECDRQDDPCDPAPHCPSFDQIIQFDEVTCSAGSPLRPPNR
jgi:hypothetical protein